MLAPEELFLMNWYRNLNPLEQHILNYYLITGDRGRVLWFWLRLFRRDNSHQVA